MNEVLKLNLYSLAFISHYKTQVVKNFKPPYNSFAGVCSSVSVVEQYRRWIASRMRQAKSSITFNADKGQCIGRQSYTGSFQNGKKDGQKNKWSYTRNTRNKNTHIWKRQFDKSKVEGRCLNTAGEGRQ